MDEADKAFRDRARARLDVTSAEPTFTYNGTANADANRKAREEAAMDAIQRAQILQAQEQATREHQWEHKVPLGSAPSPVALGSYAAARGGRTFTREEVLTVIRTLKASWQVHGSEDYDNGAKRAFANMAATIANME